MLSKKYLFLSAVLGIILLFPTAIWSAQYMGKDILTGTWQGEPVKYVEGEILFMIKNGQDPAEVKAYLARNNLSLTRDLDRFGFGKVSLPEGENIFPVIEKMQKTGFFLYVEPNMIYRHCLEPNDLEYLALKQWSLNNVGQDPPGGTPDADIDAPEAWDLTTGSSSIMVSVLDSGIPMLSGVLSHPDLDDPSKIILGQDFVGDGEGVRDRLGHGTHVSGILSAETNNGVGVAGVCWNCRIMVNQVFDRYGYGSSEGVRDGMIYSVDNGANLVNFSGGGPQSATVEHGVAYADSHDVLLVAAAGNNSGGAVDYPGAYAPTYQNVICVSSTEHTDHVSAFSSVGSEVSVAAPGGYGYPYDTDDIYSTMPDYYVTLNDYGITQNYGYCAGTSMATPHVSGLAALILAVNSSLVPSQVREIIEETAEQVGGYYYDPVTGKSTQLGHGRINAYYALWTTLFTEIDEFGTGKTFAMAWGDIDDDSDLDIVLSMGVLSGWPWPLWYDTAKIYVNDHPEPAFTELLNMPWPSHFGALALGDYDNDGDLDLASNTWGIPPAPGCIWLSRNELYSNGSSYPYTFSTFPALNCWSGDGIFDMEWGDYDNDGDLDLAAIGIDNYLYDGNVLYRNDGNDSFTEIIEFGRGGYALAWGDYDNDGDLDLALGKFLHDEAMQNKLYKNEGNGNFIELNQFGMGDTRSLAWADYDNDGDLDLAVANYDGQNKLYINNGDGTFTETDHFGADTSLNIYWGDCNNDGYLDLLVINIRGRNKLYVNDGDATFSELHLFNSDALDIAAWGDYDRDGDLDLAMGNDNQGDKNRLYRNNRNDNDYLEVKLIGRRRGQSNVEYSNRDGIGAKVKVFDQSRVTLFGFREVSSHGGAPLEAHFGVPEGNTYNIEVYWPTSGITMDTLVIAPAAITVWEYCRGDADGDKMLDLSDVLFLISYLYKGGPAPDPFSSGDANADGIVDLGDILYLNSYLYKGGPLPPPPNCP